MAEDTARAEATESAVEATAAQAAATAATEVAAAQAVAAEAVEAAAAEVQAAQDVAQQIAEAALQTELGRQVSDACGKVAQCQTAMETLATTTAETLAAMQTEMRAMNERLVALTSAPPVVVPLSPSPPPVSDQILTPNQMPEPAAVAIVNPGGVDALPAAVTATPARRTRRLI